MEIPINQVDEYQDGKLINGFDYDLQVWVIDGYVSDVGYGAKQHPEWVGQKLEDIVDPDQDPGLTE